MNETFTWLNLARPWLLDDRRRRLLEWIVPIPLVALAIWAPWPLVALVLLIAIGTWMRRDRNAIVLALAALMVNVKANYYTGFVTIFPEFPLLFLAAALLVVHWAEGEPLTDLREFWTLFLWLLVAGAVSAVNALQISRVASKGILIVLAALIFYLVLRGVRTRREMRRTLLWVEGSALASGAYAVIQVVGGLLGWDTSLSFLDKYSNPDIYLGIGAPVQYQLSRFFRANGFFNDPNILAGYLAGAISLIFALRAGHSRLPGRGLRRSFETVLLLILATALLLTLSRSGFVAVACGLGTVIVFMPDLVRRPGFWVASAVLVGLALLGSLALHINPFLLVIRLGQTFDRTDVSSHMHYEIGVYALRLLARFPFTGVGLRNFGFYYSGEIDAEYPNMTAHDAPLDFFAETGLFGGLAFLLLAFAVLRRPWRALRESPGLRGRDPERHAILVGLLAAMVALDVANLFYDYYLRTFIWVFSGLAVAASRLFEDDGKTAGA